MFSGVIDPKLLYNDMLAHELSVVELAQQAGARVSWPESPTRAEH